MPVLCDHGNPTIGSCSDCEAEAQADRAPLVARDPNRRVTERWLDNADSRTLVEAHLYYASLGSRGADRASRCLSAILRRYESESVPAEVRAWCAEQANAAEKRHEEQEQPTLPSTPCESCGKPKTTSLFRDGDAPLYLCDACYRTEWVCGACGLTLPDRNADCAECGTTSAIDPVADSPIDNSQLGASDNPEPNERSGRGFFEAAVPVFASTAPSASIFSNPAAPEDAPSVPSPAPPSVPTTPLEGDEPDGAAGVGFCSCGSLERTRACRGCGFAYCDSCRAELGDECRQPCCAPCEGCDEPVSVAVVSDSRPGMRLCGDCERLPADPEATVHRSAGRARAVVPLVRVLAVRADLEEADQRAERAEERADRLQAAVENLGRALVKARAVLDKTDATYSGNLLRLRPSSLDLAMACPASAYDLGPRVQPDTEPARAGTALHKLIAASIGQGEFRADLLDETCEAHGLGAPAASDVSRRMRTWASLWPHIRPHFPEPMVEQPLSHTLPSGVEIRGTGDLCSVVGKTGRGVDWKGGHRLGGWAHQMRSYARGLAVLHDLERVQWYVAPLEHMRDPAMARTYSRPVLDMTRDELDRWAHQVDRRVVGWDRRTYYPGDHCSRCPLRISCPAIEGEERRRANLLAPFAGPKGAALVEAIRERTLNLSDDDKALLWSAAGLAERIGKATRDALRPEVLERGGFAGLTVSRQKRSEVLPRPGWPVLAERMTDEEIARAVRIGLGECDRAVMDKAPPRGKAAAKRELREALAEAGALVETTFVRVLERGT